MLRINVWVCLGTKNIKNNFFFKDIVMGSLEDYIYGGRNISCEVVVGWMWYIRGDNGESSTEVVKQRVSLIASSYHY